MNSKITTAILIGVLLLGVGVFSAGKGSSTKQMSANRPTDVPDYAYTNDQVLKGYKSAIALYEIFEKLPCYCGCGNMQHGAEVLRHMNLRDCFIKDDGTFEEHAAGCELCVVIALDAHNQYTRGASIKDIRSAIESEYSKYGPPTKTPPI